MKGIISLVLFATLLGIPTFGTEILESQDGGVCYNKPMLNCTLYEGPGSVYVEYLVPIGDKRKVCKTISSIVFNRVKKGHYKLVEESDKCKVSRTYRTPLGNIRLQIPSIHTINTLRTLLYHKVSV